jgi:hypothetical protein
LRDSRKHIALECVAPFDLLLSTQFGAERRGARRTNRTTV